jgi:hypothetical protein
VTSSLGLTLLALSISGYVVALAVCVLSIWADRRHRERREVEARLRVLCGGEVVSAFLFRVVCFFRGHRLGRRTVRVVTPAISTSVRARFCDRCCGWIAGGHG